MRAGEQSAFDAFFNANAPRLAAYLARRSGLDRTGLEDVVQCTLIKAVRNLGSYRGEAALLTWLVEIARHELADTVRKAARRPAHVSLDDTVAARGPMRELRVPEHREPAAEAHSDSRRRMVLMILERLPDRYALALEAKYGDGLSVEEIAAKLGLTATAVQSLLARAREMFRQRWLECFTDAAPMESMS